MKRLVLTVVAALAISLSFNNSFAQTATPPAAPATGSSDLVATVSGNSDYVALGLAIRAANIETDLKAAGPLTIFAPNNAAFSALSADKLDALMKDPTKLATILKGHVVAGKYDKAALIKALATGTATLKTIDGQTLTLAVNDKKHLELTDAQGDKAQVIAFDMLANNGVAIGIDAVLAK